MRRKVMSMGWGSSKGKEKLGTREQELADMVSDDTFWAKM